MTNKELIARYAVDLEIAQILMKLHHDQGWANLLQNWRDEFERVPDTVAVKAHAARTARALGGMESLGEAGATVNDRVLTTLLEDLYATCRQIASQVP